MANPEFLPSRDSGSYRACAGEPAPAIDGHLSGWLAAHKWIFIELADSIGELVMFADPNVMDRAKQARPAADDLRTLVTTTITGAVSLLASLYRALELPPIPDAAADTAFQAALRRLLDATHTHIDALGAADAAEIHRSHNAYRAGAAELGRLTAALLHATG